MSKEKMTIEEAILVKLRELPPEKQQELLDFADFLVQKLQTESDRVGVAWQNDPGIGMWKDRSDMENSTAWVRQLRQQEWNS
jgi:hypothetical protein